MKIKGIKIVYIIAAILFVLYLIHFLSHFQSKKFWRLLQRTNNWILKQNCLLQILVYFFSMTPFELLCIPGITVFVICSSFYQKSFFYSWFVFELIEISWNLLIRKLVEKYKEKIESFFSWFEIFQIIKDEQMLENLRLAIIIRNLPINFAEKNYLENFVGITYRNYVLTSTLDSMFRISFYVFVGSTLKNIEEFFDHKKIIKSNEKRLILYGFIFFCFFTIEIIATVYGFLTYWKMKLEHQIRKEESKKNNNEMKEFEQV